MGMSLENGETFFWPKNFREICFAPHKTQIPIRINPLYRSIHSYVQSLTLPWRFHKREITEETQRRKDITGIFFRGRRPTSRDEVQLYIYFSFLFSPRFPYYISSRICRQTYIIPRDKSYFTPCFVDNTPFSPRLLLFHLIIRLCYRCTREIEGGGVKTRIILLKFCLRLSPFAILNRSDLHIRGKKFLRRSSRWLMFWKWMIFD